MDPETYQNPKQPHPEKPLVVYPTELTEGDHKARCKALTDELAKVRANLIKAQTWLKWVHQTVDLTKYQDNELESLINGIDQELSQPE